MPADSRAARPSDRPAGEGEVRSPSKYSGGVNHSDVAPIEGSCSAIGLHLLIEPVTRPLASWNVVTPLLSVRAVPVVRPIGDDAEIAARLREHHVIDMWPWRQPLRRPEPLLGLARGCPVAIAELARASAMSRAM